MATNGANIDAVYDDQRPSQLGFQAQQSGRPTKLAQQAPQQRQMTNAEKLKADKEQLKLK